MKWHGLESWFYISADVSENPLCSKGTEFMEYIKNRALNLNVIIISLKFSLAHVFIVHKESVFRIYLWVLRRNLSLGWGIIDSGSFPGCMNESKALCKVVEYGNISVGSHQPVQQYVEKTSRLGFVHMRCDLIPPLCFLHHVASGELRNSSFNKTP